MAGQLTIDTLKASTGVLATQNGMTGIAKAWVYWDGYTGGTATIKGSFNVSSVTKNGTGDYTVSYTTAMTNANYSVAGFAGSTAAGEAGTQIGMCLKKNTSPATGSVRVQTWYEGFVQSDFSYDSVIIFGS